MNVYAKARRSAGLTQRQAARALGLSVSLLGRYERDESCPNRRMVESMALLYGVPAGRLGAPRPRPAGIDRHTWPGATGRLHPSDALMAEWLVLSGAWDAFDADECAAMLEGRDGRVRRRVRLHGARPAGMRDAGEKAVPRGAGNARQRSLDTRKRKGITMTENAEALRLRMVEPLDMDEAARTLTRAGLLVPLTDWSARKRRFDTHPRGLGVLMALLVPVGVAGYASSSGTSVSMPVAVGVCVAAFVLGVALEAWIVAHHPPVPETPARCFRRLRRRRRAQGRRAPFHREGFSCLVVRDGDGLAQATLFVRHITAPDGQRTACVALFGADGLPVEPKVDRY